MLYERRGKKSPFFTSFYGDLWKGGGRTHSDGTKQTMLMYKVKSNHQSLVTLTFTADSLSFVDRRREPLHDCVIVLLCIFVHSVQPCGRHVPVFL